MSDQQYAVADNLPAWLESAQLFNAELVAAEAVPAHLMPWIALQGSMTYELGEHFGQLPDVEVHYSNRCALAGWECELLTDSRASALGYARHISLNVSTRPLLFARSVTLQDSAIRPLLSELQQTPLARLLFEDELWLRVGEPVCLRTTGPHYGRACVWQDQRSGERLVVEEFFLF